MLITDCGVLGGTSIQILWRWAKGNVWIWRTPVWVLHNGWYAYSPNDLSLSLSCINMHTHTHTLYDAQTQKNL